MSKYPVAMSNAFAMPDQLLQVPEPGPAGNTVVDDEELAALGVNAHDRGGQSATP